jgi:hypothetical protein
MNDPDAIECCINRASEAIRQSRALLDRVEVRPGLGRSSDALVTWRKSSVST